MNDDIYYYCKRVIRDRDFDTFHYICLSEGNNATLVIELEEPPYSVTTIDLPDAEVIKLHSALGEWIKGKNNEI